MDLQFEDETQLGHNIIGLFNPEQRDECIKWIAKAIQFNSVTFRNSMITLIGNTGFLGSLRSAAFVMSLLNDNSSNKQLNDQKLLPAEQLFGTAINNQMKKWIKEINEAALAGKFHVFLELDEHCVDFGVSALNFMKENMQDLYKEFLRNGYQISMPSESNMSRCVLLRWNHSSTMTAAAGDINNNNQCNNCGKFQFIFPLSINSSALEINLVFSS